MAEDESNSNLNIDDDFGDDDKSDNDDNDEEGSLATVDIEGKIRRQMKRLSIRVLAHLQQGLLHLANGVRVDLESNPVGVDLFTRAPGARQINPNWTGDYYKLKKQY